MTRKEQLTEKIKQNKENLEILKNKRENLDLNIQRLEEKIRNQEFQLSHIKVDTEVQTTAKTKEDENSSLADEILKKQ